MITGTGRCYHNKTRAEIIAGALLYIAFTARSPVNGNAPHQLAAA